MTTEPRGVLFDLDGVLIDSQPAWYRVLVGAARHFGYPPPSRQQFDAALGQGVEADRERFFPDQTVEAITAYYARAFGAEVDAVALMPGAREVLEQLASRGIRRGVVTNAPRPVARKILESKGLAGLIETLAAAGDAAEKPAPDLLLLALERLGLLAHQALYVGDSPADRQAAEAAGVRMAGLGIEGEVTLGALVELLDHLPR